jgi:hypothetical protein
MSEFTAAVIGTGGIARRHAGYYTESDRVDFAAAADISDERLNAYCDTHGIERRYLDYRQMLEEMHARHRQRLHLERHAHGARRWTRCAPARRPSSPKSPWATTSAARWTRSPLLKNSAATS